MKFFWTGIKLECRELDDNSRVIPRAENGNEG